MALEAARFQMSRKEDSWLKFLELNGQSHQELALDGVSLKKGFMAGFVRGQLTESRSDSYDDDGGGGGPDLGGGRNREGGGGGGGGGDAGYDKGMQDGWSGAVRDAGRPGAPPTAKSGTSGPEYRKGVLKGYKDAAEEKVRSEGGSEKKRDSSGGGSGPKVLKKGDAGHGGGKKKRRRY